MTDSENYPSTPRTGVPKVPPEVIRALKDQSFEFEALYKKLHREQPALTQELLNTAMQYTKDIQAREAFGKGALFMYWHIAASAESAQLRELYTTSTDDDADDEDRPPSA